jgi:hypothetical protein
MPPAFAQRSDALSSDISSGDPAPSVRTTPGGDPAFRDPVAAGTRCVASTPAETELSCAAPNDTFLICRNPWLGTGFGERCGTNGTVIAPGGRAGLGTVDRATDVITRRC